MTQLPTHSAHDDQPRHQLSVETARRSAIDRYDILDTPPEEAFDRIGSLATRLFSVPTALISFIDRDRQWFKSCFGFDLRQTDRKVSFCAHAILSDSVMVVPDATQDARFVDNWLVTGHHNVRFYAGAPLVTPDGVAMGTLCVLDTVARHDFTDTDRETLADLADMVVDELELRTALSQIARTERQYGDLLDNALDSLFALANDGTLEFMNPAFEELTGYRADEARTIRLEQIIHPEDRARTKAAFVLAREGAEQRSQARVQRADGEYISIDVLLGRDTQNGVGRIVGSARNITQQMSAERQARELASELEHRVGVLQSLARVNQAINSSLDLSDTLEVFLQASMTHLNADAAQVLLYDPNVHTLSDRATAGLHAHGLGDHTVRLGDGALGRAALERRAIHVRNSAYEPVGRATCDALEHEQIVGIYAVPLIAKGSLVGLLGIYHRRDFVPSTEWTSLARALAMQAALAIHNASLVENLQASNARLADAYDATIEGWARTLDLKDHETEGHSRRVTDASVRLARELGIEGEALAHVRRGALLHDIGKMGIPDAILLKPGKLTEAEWDVMKRHPELAYKALEGIAFLRPALDIPRFHHERFDGTGYPHGRSGRDIPLAARVFAVVDVFDALTSDRPYRQAWTEARALEHLREGSGTHFDPEVVAAFLDMA